MQGQIHPFAFSAAVPENTSQFFYKGERAGMAIRGFFHFSPLFCPPPKARTTPAVPADQHPALPAACCPLFSLGRGRPCSPKAAPGDIGEGRSPLISPLSLSGWVVKERAGGFTTWTLFLCRAPSASCGLTRLYCPRVDTWRRNWR